jgi:hypothetical protein
MIRATGTHRRSPAAHEYEDIHQGARMYRPLLVLPLLAFIGAGCSSTSTIGRHESYDGPAALAIDPVAEGRAVASPSVSRWWIQKLMAEDLGRSGIFAGVIPLTAPGEANEAGVILEASVNDLVWEDAGQRSGTLSLRVRTRDKLSREVGIDRVYSGRCDGCRVPAGQPRSKASITTSSLWKSSHG